MINIGIIGAGRIGQLHASNLAHHIHNANVVAITDMNEAAAQQTAAALQISNVVANHGALLARADVDAVLICSSTDTHAGFIEDAARAGKHIFCEKPIAFDLDEIDRALETVDRAGVKLQIGFNRRFDANARRMKAGIEQGEVGTVHRLHIISRDPSPPPIAYVRRSGGMFVDMTIHDFDMARFLMGCEATEIYTAAGVMVNPEIGAVGDVDTAVITMKFENGAIVTIDNSREAVYGYDQRMEVFGNAGSLESSNLLPDHVTHRNNAAVAGAKPLYFFLERYNQSFIVELQAFIDAIIADEPVPVSGMDGRMPVVMGLAARRSYDENRPVRLDEYQ